MERQKERERKRERKKKRKKERQKERKKEKNGIDLKCNKKCFQEFKLSSLSSKLE